MARYIVTIVLDSSNQNEQEISETIDAAIRFDSRVKRLLGAIVHDVEVVKASQPAIKPQPGQTYGISSA
jgi:hypothetical protein